MKMKSIFHITALCLFMLATLSGLAAQDVAVFTQLGHTVVNSVAFSPDGKQVLSGSWDNTVKLWDTASGMEIRTFSGHTDQVLSVAFSPDGKQALSGSKNKTIKLWDIASGHEIKTFSFPGDNILILSVAFSPDGKQALSGEPMDGGTARLWDLASGKEIKTLSRHGSLNMMNTFIPFDVTSVAFSSDGKLLLSGSDNSTIKLWDAVSGQEIRTFKGHIAKINSLAFSPDGKQILSGSFDRTIRLWDVASEQLTKTFSGHTDEVNSVAFSPNGKQILSGSDDNTVRLWDVASGKEIRIFKGHSSPVCSVIFSPDGKQLLSGSGDGMVKLWDAASGQEIRTFKGHSSRVFSVAFSPNGKQMLSGSFDNTVNLWDAVNGKRIRTFPGNTMSFSSVAFSPDGKQVISGGSFDGTVKLWDVASGQLIKTFSGVPMGNYGAFSPDGKQALIGLTLWDVASWQKIKDLKASSRSVAFSPDGKQVLLELTLWDVASGQLIRTFSGHVLNVNSVAFSPNGKQILSGSDDNTVRLWDAASGKEIRIFKGHTDGVCSVAFNPNGKQILSSSKDNTIKLWDAANGREIRTFKGHSSTIRSVAFSPDGKKVLSGSDDCTVRVWDVATGKELAQFVTFIGNDTQLASASRGLIVETETAATSNDGEWLAITSDGYYNASPRGDRYLNVRVNNTVSSIDSYRSIFYNPDVVLARLNNKPDPKSKAKVTIQQAANFLPPKVTIQSPENLSVTNTTTENLSVNITSQNQPIKNIKILVNGRLIGKDELAAVKGSNLESERASLTVTGNQKTVDLSLPLNLDPGPNRVEVVAFNGYSESRCYIDVTCNAPAGEKLVLPNLWILAIGVNAYDNAGQRLQGLGNLNFCVADAKGIMDSMKAQQGKRYGKVNSLLIADGEAQAPTAANIRQGLKFLDGAAPRDVVVLFLAGHGISAQESKFFFLPKDAAFTGDRIVDASKAISGDEIMSVLDAPGNRLVFIDACQSGGVDNDRMVRSLMDTNAFVFAASRGNELSYEDPKLGHGYFTNSVMSAIKGAPAALAQGNVSVLSMSGFVQLDVPRLTGDRQHPSAYSLGFYDFPMAFIK
jgi:WD40 repeat protein